MAVQNRPLGRIDGHSNWAQMEFVVTDGVTITANDFVYFASGCVTNATVAGARILGMATETVTGNTAGTEKVNVIIDPLMRYLVDGDQDTTALAATGVGTNYDLIGATGAQLIDTSSTSTTGSMMLVEYNPQIDPVKDDVSVGVYVIAEHPFFTGSGGQ